MLYGLTQNLLSTKIRQASEPLPGLLAAALLAWLSNWLSRFLGVTILGFGKSPISAVMMAVLLGLIIGNAIALPRSFRPGIAFVVKRVLRLGIVFMGIRLSLVEVIRLSAVGLPVVLLCVLGALFFTTRLNKRLKLPECLGTLIAVGTAICGVSAIVATGPVIEAEDEEVAYAVAVITVFGIFATLVYPYAAHFLFDADALKSGLFLGTSIHDTSQVTGAALVFADIFSSPRALDAATVTKLVRNVLMAAVIPLMALSHARAASSAHRFAARPELPRKTKVIGGLIPLFILGFLGFAALRSIGDLGVQTGDEAFWLLDSAGWRAVYGRIEDVSVALLVVALAGVGLNTRFRLLKVLGVRPFAVGLGAAFAVGLLSYAAISFLGRFFTF